MENNNAEVRFGNGSVSTVGTVAGALIAILVPWVVLAYGQFLGVPTATAIVVLALFIGGGVAAVSAFFGLVMPRHVGGPWGDPKTWAEIGKEWRKHSKKWHQDFEDDEAPSARRKR